MEQILPPPGESEPTGEESGQVEPATPEADSGVLEPEVEILHEGLEVEATEEEAPPEVYDKELAKAVEILKAERIWASANSLFR